MRSMNKLGVSILDADFIIKSAVSPSPGQSTLFEKILMLGDKFYIHHEVYEEVEWPQETTDLLDKLIKDHRIKMMNDRDLLELLMGKLQLCHFTVKAWEDGGT